MVYMEIRVTPELTAKFRRARIDSGYTVADFADVLNVHVREILMFERNGKSRRPMPLLYMKYCRDYTAQLYIECLKIAKIGVKLEDDCNV